MRITVQFHPDWPFGERCVIEALADDGVYRSQFETGTSNGGLTAFPGGDRWRWESRIFAGRYDDAEPAARPVYGALDAGSPYGASPRFGSAHLRLRPEVTERATFCFPDSVFEPTEVGGPERARELAALCEAADLDDLDRYVEAHVHGGLRVDRDVEAVVLDPCFRDGPVAAAAERLGCAVEWHPGFQVATAGLDPDYRAAAAIRAQPASTRSSTAEYSATLARSTAARCPGSGPDPRNSATASWLSQRS